MKTFMLLVASLGLILLGMRAVVVQVGTPTELFRRLTEVVTDGDAVAEPAPLRRDYSAQECMLFQSATMCTANACLWTMNATCTANPNMPSMPFPEPNASTNKGLEDWWNNPQDKASSGGGYGFSWFFYLLCACIYKAKVVDELQDPIPMKDGMQSDMEWNQIGLFGCFSNCNTLLYVCCLPTLVAAKNYDKAEVMDFWPACILLQCTYQCWCVGACVRTYLSAQLKDRFGIRTNLVTDCLINWCCFPCEIGREEIFINRQLGVTIGCPCSVEYMGGPYDSGSEFGSASMGPGQYN